MKLYSLFFILLSLSACGSRQQITKDIPIEMQNISCPETGNCSIEVLKNSSLQIKTDSFGKIYPEIQEGDHLVIKYQFKKNTNKKNKDASYSEFVYFEINNKESQLILKDAALQKVKMLFGRICFCRDANGYFKIDQGNLYFFRNNNTLQFNLKFNIPKVPHILSHINESIKY
ncbi:MAG: hypothetical protein J7K34_00185 [Flavobacteriaceae bacterium]|nr:hypothetical protein [Flavobacteriaceae bacterium]